jgi:hypothetical protein
MVPKQLFLIVKHHLQVKPWWIYGGEPWDRSKLQTWLNQLFVGSVITDPEDTVEVLEKHDELNVEIRKRLSSPRGFEQFD